MDVLSIVVIFVGAGFGALVRWLLGMALNPVFPTLPLGTLAANLIGGLLIGATMGLFEQFQTLPPALRLAIATPPLPTLRVNSEISAIGVL